MKMDDAVLQVLKDIRLGIVLLRAQGVAQPLPPSVCIRCNKKDVPCERIEGHSVCPGCLILIVDEFAAYVRHRKAVLIPRALEAGQMSVPFGTPAGWEEAAKESAEREALATEGTT